MPGVHPEPALRLSFDVETAQPEPLLAIHHLDIDDRGRKGAHYFNANHYNLLIQMVLNGQGVALGWDHFRPVEQEMALEESRHYLAYCEDRADDDALSRFRNWFMAQCGV